MPTLLVPCYTLHGGATIPLSVLTAFADVGPKVLVGYYNHS